MTWPAAIEAAAAVPVVEPAVNVTSVADVTDGATGSANPVTDEPSLVVFQTTYAPLFAAASKNRAIETSARPDAAVPA